MKKRMILLSLMALLGLSASAREVPQAVAQAVAERFMQSLRPQAWPAKIVEQALPPDVQGMRLFVADGGGFVLVASDDRVRPVLAYSTEDDFATDVPDHVRAWLRNYAEEIAWLASIDAPAPQRVTEEWQQWTTGVDGADAPQYNVVVQPLLTTRWNQSPRYNNLCPLNTTTNVRCVTGCVATAMAQIMKYWNHPKVGEGSHSYDEPTYGQLSADFGSTTYQWNSMTNALTATSSSAAISAVATLMYHVGVSVNMKYGPTSSASTAAGASITAINSERALRTHFRYDKAIHSIHKDLLNDSVWVALLINELVEGRPVLYSGRDTSGGHAFVCDGHNSSGQFHINWGWGGSCDGYYTMGALNPASSGTGGNATHRYNLSQAAVVGICPDTVLTGTHTVRALPFDTRCGTVTGGATGAYGDTLTLTATANRGYRFVYWSDGMNYNPRSVIVGGDKEYFAVYEPVTGDTLYYDRGTYEVGWGYSTPTPFFWGIRFDTLVLARHTQLNAVQAFVKPGLYQLRIHNGATPTAATLKDTLEFRATGDKGWRTITLPAPLTIDPSKPLWLILYNDSVPYVASSSIYAGEADAAYSSSRRYSGWSTPTSKRTFMIRGIFQHPIYYYDLTLQAATDSGSVTGAGRYLEGDTATLAATAARCYRFSHWSDGSSENPRRLVVTGNRTLTAHFDTVTREHVDVVEACDSLRWTDGQLYTVTGEYTRHDTTLAGCDSAVVLRLSVHPSVTTTDTVTAEGSYHWAGGAEYTESGTYRHDSTTVHGCDSTAILVLTITEPPVYYTVTLLADADSGSVTGAGRYEEGTTVTLAATAAACYRFRCWDDGVADNPRSLVLTADTTLRAHFDTVRRFSADTVTATDSLLWIDGRWYTASGEYSHHALTPDGCDSTVLLVLTIDGQGNAVTTPQDGQHTVYPNPVQHTLVLGQGAAQRAALYDAAGRLVAQCTGCDRLDVSALPQGTYMLEVLLPTGTTHRYRIVKR